MKKFCNRTLFGARPPKGQEMEDHYFGSIKPRVAEFMKELDMELWKLGVLSKTKHNEVAPSQHELAPIHTVTNVATDHNQITMDLMKSITQEYEKTEIPAFGVGDTVRVHIKIKEGNRERIQVFEGFVLKRQNGGISETFTVRKISSGVGVEKTFPLHSPKIEKIEVTRRGAVRRAKLNYMRERTGKAAKIKTKE